MKSYQPKETHYYDTFHDFITGIGQLGSEPAVTTYRRGSAATTYSYAQLSEDSLHFAAALCQNGLQGKHLAILSENSYEWLVAFFGMAAAGGVSVCLDLEYPDHTLQQMMARADADLILASPALRPTALSIAKQLQIQTVFITQTPASDPHSFDHFMESAGTEGWQLLHSIRLNPRQTAAIFHTSGTTSAAKPVMLSHQALLYNAGDSLTLLDSGPRIFGSLPLYHTYGFTCSVLCPLIRGAHLGLNCDLKRMIQEIYAFQPHTIVAVPLIIESIHHYLWSCIEKAHQAKPLRFWMALETFFHCPGRFAAKKFKKIVAGQPLQDLSLFLSGGAYLSPEIARDLEHFGIIVLQGYGITECSPSIACNRNEDYRLTSVGHVLPHFQIRIWDDEIQVKGPSLMNGYYQEPALTEAAFQDGWFQTGDLGYFDKRGHLHITGRKKNLIVMKNGKKVTAEEIESLLQPCPLVQSVMAYGVPVGQSIDDVKIAVAVFPDPALLGNQSRYEVLERLQRYVREVNAKLPSYKQIQMIHIRETDFERTSSQKIKRTSETESQA